MGLSPFKGLSAFPITPTDAEGRLIEAEFARLLERLVAAEVDSIAVLGSTGTYAYLSEAVRNRAVALAVEVIGGRVPVIAGISALRTDAAVSFAKAAEGADGVLLAPMSYTPLTPGEVERHVRTVADATARPLCLYNNPSTTHFTFSRNLIASLASHPHIAAVKMPLTDDPAAEIAALRGVTPDGFVVGYSGDWGCSAARMAGADCWFSVIGGILPDVALALDHAARRGDAASVARWEAALAPLWHLFRTHGSLRVVYAMASLIGVSQTQPPLPILPLDATVVAEVDAAMGHLGAADPALA